MQTLLWLNVFCGIFYFHFSLASRFMTSLQVKLGYSASAIGNTLGFVKLVTSFLSPVVSSIADTYKIHKAMIISQTIIRLVPLVLMWYIYAYGSLTLGYFFVLNSLISLSATGVWPMSDSLILASLEDSSTYGRVRLWGALTYGIGNMFIGCLILWSDSFSPMFSTSILSAVVAIPAVYYILPSFANAVKPKEPITFPVIKSIILSSRSTQVFFINSVIIGGGMSLVESLLFVAMERSMDGSSPIIAGTSVLISVMFEIPIFQIAPQLIKSYGTKRMLVVANLAWIIRAVGYALFDHAWVVLLLELLHGISFGLFYSAAVHICVQQSPPGMESTMQSLLDMTYAGFGVALGDIAGGFLFDVIGSSATFILFSVLVASSTILCQLFFVETIDTSTKELSQAHEFGQELQIVGSD
jgi:PPP family 3-phenylpropionic acid transporter